MGGGGSSLALSPLPHNHFLPINALVWGLVGLCWMALRPALAIMAVTSPWV